MTFNGLRRTVNAVDRIVDRVGRGAAWLVVVVILLLFAQLPLRELVGGGHILANDFGQLIHATVFMFGLSFALRWDRHVRMDVFHRRFRPRTRAWIELGGALFCVLPWCGLLIGFGWTIMWRSVAVLEKFPDTWSPGYFVFKVLVVVCVAVLALQALAVVGKSLLVLLDVDAEGRVLGSDR